MMSKTRTLLLLTLLGFYPFISFAKQQVVLRAPLGATLEFQENFASIKPQGTQFEITLEDNFIFPAFLKVKGPLGGRVTYKIDSLSEFRKLKINSKIIPLKDSNPKDISSLPLLCPRVKLIHSSEEGADIQGIYQGEKDRLNHTPVFQLLEPDAHANSQYLSYTEMDGKNVLLLKNVEIHYDYEDTNIIDYEGPDPATGKHQIIQEGGGGFYANIHYAIFPFDKDLLNLDRQTLLHLAQGKLREINRDDLYPKIKTHAFIPGPFLSREGYLYGLCEWGDTAYHAPIQKLAYEEVALWDWEYPVKNADHILLIIWEGDEEDWLIQKNLINPFYLTDDLIGVFEIKKEETKKPLTLTNKSQDFKITLQTGDLKISPN